MLLTFMMGNLSCNKKTKSPELQYSDSLTTRKTHVYTFTMLPLNSPATLVKIYQPLVDYLNQRLKGGQMTFETSIDYPNFEQKFKERKPEFILPNPWQTLEAMKSGYTVIAMAGEPSDFTGVFVIRKDSKIREPKDLIGKTVSYPSPTALAACIMPQYYLYQHGIDVNKDMQNYYVGTQEASVMNVYAKTTSAGAIYPPSWRVFKKENPLVAAQLKVIWETEPLINQSIMVRDDVPVSIREQVRKYLLELDKTAEGKKILDGIETARFLPGTDKDYDLVKIFIDHFEKKVRKIETKQI